MRAPIALAAAALALSGCTKSADPKASRVPAPKAAFSADKQARLLQAELRRDPSGVLEDDLLAEDDALRLAAVRSLARIADERSFEPLAKALADEQPEVIAWAAFGVGQLCRGHEPAAVRRLVLRAASLAATPQGDSAHRAVASIALALGRCASDEAERTLRSWLKLAPPNAAHATLGLAQVARQRKHLDDRTVAALLDLADKAPESAALHPIESLPTLGPAARQRLAEVASKALEQASSGRAFAVRALAKAGTAAAAPLRRLLEAEATPDSERADAARSLAALGSAGQADLAAALVGRARALLDGNAWLTSKHGVVLTILDGLEPSRADAELLTELAQLPLAGEPEAIVRRKVMLRCRAAQLLAGRASASQQLLACDPGAADERREGALALLKVLGRGSLSEGRGARFQELARSRDRVVREAALELLTAHDEATDIPELLAEALSAPEVGVRATAAKVLARYPSRAQAPDDTGAAPITDLRVVRALSKQLEAIGSLNIELSTSLLDAAVALELLGVKPALERACVSDNPTLRQHAERGFAQLREPGRRCPSVPGQEIWNAAPTGDVRLQFDTDVGPLEMTLWGEKSPFASQRIASLARAGFFDGLRVHRVVPGFVAQLGDPDGDGFGGPDLPPLRDQASSETFEPGSVGIALAGRDTGLGQIFVTLRAAPHLSGEYTQIGRAGPGWDRLAYGDRIDAVRVLEASPK